MADLIIINTQFLSFFSFYVGREAIIIPLKPTDKNLIMRFDFKVLTINLKALFLLTACSSYSSKIKDLSFQAVLGHAVAQNNFCVMYH